MDDERLKRDLDELLLIVKDLKNNQKLNHSHSEEHEYLRQMIAEHKARKEFWSKALTNVASAGLWSTIVLIGGALVFSFKNWISM